MNAEKLVKELGKLNRNGTGLGNAFVIEALHRYANEILSDSTDWGNSVISKQAWQLIAQRVMTALNEEE